MQAARIWVRLRVWVWGLVWRIRRAAWCVCCCGCGRGIGYWAAGCVCGSCCGVGDGRTWWVSCGGVRWWICYGGIIRCVGCCGVVVSLWVNDPSSDNSSANDSALHRRGSAKRITPSSDRIGSIARSRRPAATIHILLTTWHISPRISSYYIPILLSWTTITIRSTGRWIWTIVCCIWWCCVRRSWNRCWIWTTTVICYWVWV